MAEHENQKLIKVFSDSTYFRIPDYQRGYAWRDDKQLPELWEDLLDILPDEDGGYHPHFTGTLSLRRIPLAELKIEAEKNAKQMGADFLDVVDGQQRLTTIVILLFVLGKYLKKTVAKEVIEKYVKTSKRGGRSAIYRFAYGMNNNNNDIFLKKEIFEDKDTLPCKENVYTHNLSKAKTFFTDRIKDMKPKQREELYKKVTTALVFDIKYIDDSLDVQAVFETMNNRGKPLTTLEKLKNRMLYLTDKLPDGDKDELARIVNRGWGNIYEQLGKNAEILLDEDDFLSAHMTLIRVPRDYAFSEQLAEKKVFEMFCSRASSFPLSYARYAGEDVEPKVTYEKIKDYVIDISNFVQFWCDVNLPDYEKPLGQQLARILFLDRSKEVRTFLAELASMRKENAKDVDEILALLERILFRNTLPCPKLMDIRTVATRARELHNGELSLNELISSMTETLSEIITVDSLSRGFRGLFEYSRGGIGFYRWTGLKFFLFKFEEYVHLKGNKTDFEKLKWCLFDETSVEHVMPRHWWDHWAKTMESYISVVNPTDDTIELARKVLINTLGNLTVLKDSKNSSLGNSPWDIKRPVYASGCYSEIAISKYTVWDYNTVLARGKEMLDFLGIMLGISFSQTKDNDDYANVLFFSKTFCPERV